MKHILFSFLFAFLFLSCSKENISVIQPVTPIEVVVPDYGTVIAGCIRVKMGEEIAQTKAIQDCLSDMNVISITRTFPYAGKFEERTRAEGLHLWYDIQFDPTVSMTKAAKSVSNMNGVKYVEYISKPRLLEDVIYPFNDPFLYKQWNYYNDGSAEGYEAGCDINLYEAWGVTTGNDNVIVCVVDQGVQWDHEDLSDNMWVNEAEHNGVVGVDDDNNGYVDDIYGYNFCVSTQGIMYGEITPGNHGCNVASIVSAVNNNGKGYCGIAGGNGATKGARIMSCQIINEIKSGSYPERAIKYSADNGAVISQNSWSSDSYSQATNEAIDYFNKYAGFDENGVQVGPMAGGIVFFAAGNENTDIGYPAEYKGAKAVAALGANFRKASYSNFGSWVDISAPGGDGYPSPVAYVWGAFKDNKYGGMSGTSQACPHLSGIAALILAKFGGKGFTNEMLWDKMVNACKSVDEYNSAYVGKLGVGLIDAYKCLNVSDPNPPDKVVSIWSSSVSNTINLKWLVPNDDSGKPYGYDIYYSKNDLSSLDIKGALPNYVSKAKVKTGTKEVGDTLYLSLPDLDLESLYFIRIDCYDNSNNHSGLSKQISQHTFINNPPVITPKNGTSVVVKAHETKQLVFGIYDPDGHAMTIDFVNGSNAATASQSGEDVVVTIVGKNASPATYSALLKVSDPYSTTQMEMNYTILPNHAPKVIKEPDNLIMSEKSESISLNLSNYFVDEDGEVLTYTVESSSVSKIVETSISGDNLTINGNWYGQTTLTITATDMLGLSVSTSFVLLLRDGSQEIDLYPNPVKEVLNIRMGKSTSAHVDIISTLGAKAYSGDVSISPFEPAQIITNNFEAGQYTVIVNVDGKEIKRNIVKL